jgi:hypothetical protein
LRRNQKSKEQVMEMMLGVRAVWELRILVLERQESVDMHE